MKGSVTTAGNIRTDALARTHGDPAKAQQFLFCSAREVRRVAALNNYLLFITVTPIRPTTTSSESVSRVTLSRATPGRKVPAERPRRGNFSRVAPWSAAPSATRNRRVRIRNLSRRTGQRPEIERRHERHFLDHAIRVFHAQFGVGDADFHRVRRAAQQEPRGVARLVDRNGDLFGPVIPARRERDILRPVHPPERHTLARDTWPSALVSAASLSRVISGTLCCPLPDICHVE